MICTQCGFDNPIGNKYCQICGDTLIPQPDHFQHSQAASSTLATHQIDEANPIGDRKEVLLGFSPINKTKIQNQEFDNPPSQPPMFTPQTRQETLLSEQELYPLHQQQTNPPTPPYIPQQAPIPVLESDSDFPPLPPMPRQQDPMLENPPLPPMPGQFQKGSNSYNFPTGVDQTAPGGMESRNQQSSRPNALPLVLSALAIILLIVGYFLPLISARINDSGIMGFMMSDLIGSDFAEFKNVRINYSPTEMLLKKPPQISAGKLLTNEETRQLNQEMREAYNELNSYSNGMGMTEEFSAIEKSLSAIRMVGFGLLILIIGIIIALAIKQFTIDSQIPKFVTTFFVAFLLITLFGGLIYITTYKINLGEFGGLLGVRALKLSDFIKISPGIGYFLLVGGSISALVSALIKRS